MHGLVATSDAASSVYVLTAFGGGLISFLSPCVLPIVPGYLSLVTGLSLGEIHEGDRRYLGRIALNTGMFVLGSVLGFAAQGRNVTHATLLLVAYSLGLGVAFLAVGLAMGKLTKALDWFKRHSRVITFVSAALLAVFGVILLDNALPRLTADLQNFLRSLGLQWLVNIG